MPLQAYFNRFGFCERQIAEPPLPDLGLAVIIPCCNEPALLATLDSVWSATRPDCAVEVIVVVNSSAAASADVLRQNELTREETLRWAAGHQDSRLRFHLLNFPSLPRKHAGVGLARKIAMDESLRRLGDVGRLDSPIVSLDADSLCEPNYLTAIHSHFLRFPRSPGCSIYFEHPLAGPESPEIYEAICLYETHLRYYVQALRWCGFPHAFHTVGSSMAVRARVYRDQGGMNRRQAGEDFYFLHKVIPLGHYSVVNETRVIPSPRVSDRVPFGTGRAVGDYMSRGQMETYPFQAFADLKLWLSQMQRWVNGESAPLAPETLQRFLDAQGFALALEEMRRHTASPDSLLRRFFRWFDGFRAMKFIHFARDHYYGPGSVEAEVVRFLEQVQPRPAGACSLPRSTFPRQLLESLRHLDRQDR